MLDRIDALLFAFPAGYLAGLDHDLTAPDFSDFVVLCTDDLEILQWARLEAMAGNAQVVDVNPGRAMAPADSTQGS